jgi:hypothetical protein
MLLDSVLDGEPMQVEFFADGGQAIGFRGTHV